MLVKGSFNQGSKRQMDSGLDCKAVAAFHKALVWPIWSAPSEAVMQAVGVMWLSHTPSFSPSDVNLTKRTLVLGPALAVRLWVQPEKI